MTWFVVGPNVEVRERAPGGFAVTRNGRMLAVAEVAEESGTARIALRPANGSLDEDLAGEALRLLARVVWRRESPRIIEVEARADTPAAAALRRDGFEAAGARCWRRAGAPFVLRSDEKVGGAGESYNEPLFVPWQFVPVDDDVIGRAGAELAARGNARVLDLGCGYGKNLPSLETIAPRLFAIDISPAAVRRCRTLAASPQRILAASATALPWRDASFDCVIDIGCVHCVPRHQASLAVAEAARVLAADGVLLSRVFLPRDPQWLAAQPFRTTAFGYTADDAAALFGRAFADVQVERGDQLTYLRCAEPRR